MSYPYACPECRQPGEVRLVSRSQLEFLARDAGLELRPWPSATGTSLWWCDGCQNGGAVYRWSVGKRSA
jgi:hypothetical protein